MVNSPVKITNSKKPLSYILLCRTQDKAKRAALKQKMEDYWFFNFENNAIRAIGGNPCDGVPDYI